MNYSTVHLRNIQEEDASVLATVANERELWLTLRDRFPHPYGLADAEGYISYIHGSKTEIVKVIEVDGEFAGIAGVILMDDVYDGTGEVGYWLGKAYWSKGIMTKALQAFVSFCKDDLKLRKLEAGVFSSNPASMKVLEKCGFVMEGVKRSKIIKAGEILDEHMYGLVIY